MTLEQKRWIIVGLAIVFLLSLLFVQRLEVARRYEEVGLAELNRQIDSLRAWSDSLQVDSVTLERIARERFGMIRDREILYRFAQPSDSTLPSSDTTRGATRR